MTKNQRYTFDRISIVSERHRRPEYLGRDEPFQSSNPHSLSGRWSISRSDANKNLIESSLKHLQNHKT